MGLPPEAQAPLTPTTPPSTWPRNTQGHSLYRAGVRTLQGISTLVGMSPGTCSTDCPPTVSTPGGHPDGLHAPLSSAALVGQGRGRRRGGLHRAGQVPLGLGGCMQGSSVAACPGTDIFTSSVFQICPEKRTCHGLGTGLCLQAGVTPLLIPGVT